MASRSIKQLGAAAIIALGTTAALAADIYKWIDDAGSVNYAAKPPANRPAKTLDPAASRLTIYQSNIHEIERRWREADAKRARVETIEPAIAAPINPYASALPGGSEKAYRELWLKRCRDDRRVDCDDPFAFFGYGAGVPYYPYGPVVIVPPPRRVSLPIAPAPAVHPGSPRHSTLQPQEPPPGTQPIRGR